MVVSYRVAMEAGEAVFNAKTQRRKDAKEIQRLSSFLCDLCVFASLR
jgi:ribosomal 50S subunit-associated protein YjgA (DUF615 family)